MYVLFSLPLKMSSERQKYLCVCLSMYFMFTWCHFQETNLLPVAERLRRHLLSRWTRHHRSLRTTILEPCFGTETTCSAPSLLVVRKQCVLSAAVEVSVQGRAESSQKVFQRTLMLVDLRLSRRQNASGVALLPPPFERGCGCAKWSQEACERKECSNGARRLSSSTLAAHGGTTLAAAVSRKRRLQTARQAIRRRRSL
jgi:hypothetical protein